MSSAVATATESFSTLTRKGLLSSPGVRTFLFSLVLAIATLAVYSPVHKAKFISYDDGVYVLDNTHVKKGLTWNMFRWSLFTFYAGNWHPLTWVSHAADVELFQLNPAGHHDTNLFLHTVNVLLLFWVLQRATGYSGRSFVVAALFAIHPMNVESVAWIAERKTLLSMLFFLLALGVYRWYAREPRVARYLAFASLFVLGLTAKPQVVTFPLVLLLWDYWPLQRMFGSASGPASGTAIQTVFPARSLSQLIWEKVPLFLIIAVDSAVTMKAQRVARPSNWSYTFWIRTGNAIVAYARYLEKAFWPRRLALFYPHPGNSLVRWHVLVSALVLVAISAIVALNWRRRYLMVGWLWFLGTMVPMIGIVQVGRQAMADRYAYLPFIGLFIMVCWGVAEWAQEHHLHTASLAATAVVVLLALTAITHRQLDYWLDNAKLWAHTLEVTSPANWFAESALGDALWENGYHQEALQRYCNVLIANPAEPRSNLGVAFYEHEQGNLADALVHYKRALGAMDADDKNRYQALVNMAYVYKKLGDTEYSRECFEAAAKLQPR